MRPVDELRAWVGFCAEDEVRLQRLWVVVEPRAAELTTRFYAKALQFPGAAGVFRDQAQVERLRRTLLVWVSELLQGPWDDAYVERRERIGRVHVEVGLEARYMFAAMNIVRDQLCELAHGLPDSGDVCRSVGRVCDIDLALMTGTFVERREARELRTFQELIVSHMPVTVFILDRELRVVAATRSNAGFFGSGDPVGRRWAEVLPEALLLAGELEPAMTEALATQHEVTVPRVDTRLEGLDRSFRVSIIPLDHPRAAALLHVEELTEAVANEARLVRAESLAHLGALSAAVAHELRNPLAGISGAIQVISRSMPAEDRRKAIMEKVEAQVRRLDDLVTELLDFARPVAPRAAPMDLAEVARSVLDGVRRAHPEARLEVVGSGGAQADGNMVAQILLNLVLNAAQAAGERAHIRLVVTPGRVLVNDDGPGVPAGDVDKIFQPFFTTRTRGTGLGLAICRKLAGAMGGELRLGRGPLPGAAFLVELPLSAG